MRHRFPGLGLLLSVSATLALSGCTVRRPAMTASSGNAAAEAAPGMPAPAPPPPSDAAPSAQAGVEAPRETGVAMPGAVGSTTAAPATAAQAAEPSREMLDIEGSVSLQVPTVKLALRALRELTKRAGGVVTEERVDSTSAHGSAQVTLR